METGSICAYNVSQNVLLSEHVAEVSEELGPEQFLALLLNGPGISRQAAVWLCPFTGSLEWPPRLFAFDLLYLDPEQVVLEAASVGPGSDFPQMPPGVASILFLPDSRIEETGSTRGNVIRICPVAELAASFDPASYSSFPPQEANVQAQSLQNQAEDFSLEGRRLRGFAFEAFAGTLVYLPDPVAPAPQSSEFFLTREEPETMATPVQIPPEPVQQEELHVEPILPLPAETPAAKSDAPVEREPEEVLSPALRAKILEMEEELRLAREAKNARRWRAEKPAAHEPAHKPLEEPLPEFANIQPETQESQIEELPSAATLPQDVQEDPEQIPAGVEIGATQLREQAAPESTIAEASLQAIQPPPLVPGHKPDAVSREWEAIEERVRRSVPGGAQEQTSMGVRFRRWLSGVGGSRARRFKRFPMPGLVAFYWTGGAPKPHEIVNISKSGFYVRTKDLWLPDTLVRMTLQRPDHNGQDGKRTIGVLARVVRIDDDGVGHEFVTSETLARMRSQEILPEKGTSSKELERFLSLR